MGYSIDIADAAEGDIRKAFLYYEDKKEDLGSTFENYVDEAVDSIQINPLKTSKISRHKSFLFKNLSLWHPFSGQ